MVWGGEGLGRVSLGRRAVPGARESLGGGLEFGGIGAWFWSTRYARPTWDVGSALGAGGHGLDLRREGGDGHSRGVPDLLRRRGVAGEGGVGEDPSGA